MPILFSQSVSDTIEQSIKKPGGLGNISLNKIRQKVITNCKQKHKGDLRDDWKVIQKFSFFYLYTVYIA